MQNELIIISEYCDKCHIEPSFIEMLQEGGLIDIRTEDGERCLLFSQLPDVERYSRMYYDLSIKSPAAFPPFIICWNVWRKCSRRFIRCTIS